MNLKKIFLVFFFFFYIFASLYTANKVYASVTLNFNSAAPAGNKVSDAFCGLVIQQCWNSQNIGVTDCGTACPSDSDTSAWSKYEYSGCYEDPLDPGVGYFAWLPKSSIACSTGDKYNSSNPPVMDAGKCSATAGSCDVGGAYKTCCNGTTPVSARSFPVDPFEPLEADCGSNTEVRCGAAGEPACGQPACDTLAPARTCDYSRSYNECCGEGLSHNVDEYTWSDQSGVCNHVVGACNQSDSACVTAVPTATPTPLPAPNITSFTCSGNPGTLNVVWSSVVGAATYALRIDDKANGWGGDSPLSGDTVDNNASSPYSRATSVGPIYEAWVHAVDSRGVYSASSNHVNVACSGPTPTSIPTATPTPTPTITPTPSPTPTQGPNNISVIPDPNNQAQDGTWQQETITRNTSVSGTTDIGFYNPGVYSGSIGDIPSTGWTRPICTFSDSVSPSFCTWTPSQSAAISQGSHTFGLFNSTGALLAVTSVVFNPYNVSPPASVGCALSASPRTVVPGASISVSLSGDAGTYDLTCPDGNSRVGQPGDPFGCAVGSSTGTYRVSATRRGGGASCFTNVYVERSCDDIYQHFPLTVTAFNDPNFDPGSWPSETPFYFTDTPQPGIPIHVTGECGIDQTQITNSFGQARFDNLPFAIGNYDSWSRLNYKVRADTPAAFTFTRGVWWDTNINDTIGPGGAPEFSNVNSGLYNCEDRSCSVYSQSVSFGFAGEADRPFCQSLTAQPDRGERPLDVVFNTIAANPSNVVAKWNPMAVPLTSQEMVGYATAAVNGYVYITGGYYSSAVYAAKVNDDGTLGQWSTVSSLPKQLHNHTATVYNGFLFVVGGMANDGTTQSAVYAAKVNDDGTLDQWTTLTSLPQPRYTHATVAIKGYLFVTGGLYGSFSKDTTYSAKITINGDSVSLGDWTETTKLSIPLYYHSAAAANDYIFIAGGNDNSGWIKTVKSAYVNSDGTINAWQTLTDLSYPGVMSNSAVSGNYLYVTSGGFTQFAPINQNNGTLREEGWQMSETPTFIGAWPQSAVLANGYIVVVTTSLNASLAAKINANGTLQSFENTYQSYPPIWYSKPVMVNNYLFMVGGAYGTASLANVLRAQYQTDGTLGPWVSKPEWSLPNPGTSADPSYTLNPGQLVANRGNNIYVIANYNHYGANVYKFYNVQVNSSDGSLGSWLSRDPNFPAGFTPYSMTSYGNKLIVSGTRSEAGAVTAKILRSTDSLNWEELPMPQVDSPYGIKDLFVANDYLYLIDFNGTTTNVFGARIRSGGGSLDSWARLTAPPNGHFSNAFASNGYAFVTGLRFTENGLQTSVDFVSAVNSSDGTLGPWLPLKRIPGVSHMIGGERDYLITPAGSYLFAFVRPLFLSGYSNIITSQYSASIDTSPAPPQAISSYFYNFDDPITSLFLTPGGSTATHRYDSAGQFHPKSYAKNSNGLFSNYCSTDVSYWCSILRVSPGLNITMEPGQTLTLTATGYNGNPGLIGWYTSDPESQIIGISRGVPQGAIITVNAISEGTATLTVNEDAGVSSDPLIAQRNCIPQSIRVTVNVRTSSWFQGVGGDMRMDSGFVDSIPQGRTGMEPYASLPGRGDGGGGQTPGVIFSGGSTPNFGVAGGRASKDYDWQAGSGLWKETFTPVSGAIRTSYDYMTTTARQNGIVPNPFPSDISQLTNGLYKSEGDLTLSGTGYTFPNGKNYVILVNGNLNISENIIVPVGSTVTFSVSGKITVDKAVTKLEGFYSSDSDIVLEGNDIAGCQASPPTPDTQLSIAGALVTNAKLQGGQIINHRNLCSNNKTTPSFKVFERLDFILNAPDFLKSPNYIWQEVAP
ncbi:MAG: hypothetical protein HYV37_04060 [Candidatus Levyibacteriota bacterium]|nr:MAG: hypothetical protein HYV37_04060 [Candidatus Levybacteria bacterium]